MHSRSGSATLVMSEGEHVHAVVLDLEGADVVDSQGAAKLSEILDYTESIHVELRLARVKPAVAEVLGKDGVLDRLGPDRIHGNVDRAVEAELAADRSIVRP